MNFGETFQQLRKNKRITLKEAAASSISAAQLSRFENNKTMLTVDQFFHCLENINVSIEEFRFVQKETIKDHYQLDVKRMETFLNQNQKEKSILLMNELHQRSTSAYSWPLFLGDFIQYILALNEDNDFIGSDTRVVRYLHQVDDWGEMELRLFSIFSFLFEPEELYRFSKGVIKKANSYLALPQTQRLYFDILYNLFQVFIYRNKISYAREILQLTGEALGKKVDLLFPQIDYLYNKGVLCYKEQQVMVGDQYFDQALSVCRIFRQKERLKQFQNQIQQWRTSHEEPNFKMLTLNLSLFS
ncbi:Rgg/GadR/MutR family transcriptional regulator [Enterococcus massiliensis]|uniref:Rgg/GadR/MutR family transcriptional regulator n=1 Tax=Enterococcus massiliensis TaxID=1640685 RepID=UPI00065E8859|nr:Rgg/GadR/MutR family transcriptional regulator [Enterococcus massiliensis]